MPAQTNFFIDLRYLFSVVCAKTQPLSAIWVFASGLEHSCRVLVD